MTDQHTSVLHAEPPLPQRNASLASNNSGMEQAVSKVSSISGFPHLAVPPPEPPAQVSIIDEVLPLQPVVVPQQGYFSNYQSDKPIDEGSVSRWSTGKILGTVAGIIAVLITLLGIGCIILVSTLNDMNNEYIYSDDPVSATSNDTIENYQWLDNGSELNLYADNTFTWTGGATVTQASGAYEVYLLFRSEFKEKATVIPDN